MSKEMSEEEKKREWTDPLDDHKKRLAAEKAALESDKAIVPQSISSEEAARSVLSVFDDIAMNDDDYKKIEDQKYHIQQFLPNPGVFMLVGDSNVGKSWLAFMIARRVLDSDTGTSVVFVDIDAGAVYTKKRVHIMWEAYGKPRFQYVSQVKADVADVISRLKSLAQIPLNNQVIILDSLTSFAEGNVNESKVITPFLLLCESLRNAGATVILIHHIKRERDASGGGQYAGSYVIRSKMDALYMVTKKDKIIECELNKSRGDYVSRSFKILNFEGMQAEDVEYISPEDKKAEAAENRYLYQKDKVITIISKKPLQKTQLIESIIDRLELSKNKARNLLKRLEDERVIGFTKGGANNEMIAQTLYGIDAGRTEKVNADPSPTGSKTG